MDWAAFHIARYNDLVFIRVTAFKRGFLGLHDVITTFFFGVFSAVAVNTGSFKDRLHVFYEVYSLSNSHGGKSQSR